MIMKIYIRNICPRTFALISKFWSCKICFNFCFLFAKKVCELQLLQHRPMSGEGGQFSADRRFVDYTLKNSTCISDHTPPLTQN